MFKRIVAAVGLSALIVAFGGCSAGSTGGGAPNPPVSKFSFTAPAESSQVTKDQIQTLTLTWTSNGSPISNQTITFDASVGSLVGDGNSSGATVKATTLANGVATVQFVSDNTGATTITASAKDPVTDKALTARVDLAVVGSPATLSASAPTPIASSGTSLITAIVKDSNGTALVGVDVGFALADGGGALSVKSGKTDSNGAVRSVFTPDGTQDSVTVDVTQDLLTMQTVNISVIPPGGQPPAKLTFSSCPASLPSVGSVDCTINLVDGNGKAMSSQTVNLSSVLGTFKESGGTTQSKTTTVQTDTDGNATFTYQAFTTMSSTTPAYPQNGISGKETLTATVANSSPVVTQTYDINVEPASFGFTSPADQSQVVEGHSTPVDFKWTSNGVVVSAQTTTLSLAVTYQNGTAGTAVLVDASNASGQTLKEKTDSSGSISVGVLSNTYSANSVLTASAVDPSSGAKMNAGISLALVGVPHSMILNAATPIPIGGTSLITAQVKDSAGTPLVGQIVLFAVKAGTGNGRLTALSGKTDSTGTASATYTAINDSNGAQVEIDATVSPAPMQSFIIAIGD